MTGPKQHATELNSKRELQCTPRTHPSHTRRIRRKQKYVHKRSYVRECGIYMFQKYSVANTSVDEFWRRSDKKTRFFLLGTNPRSKFWPRGNWSKVNELCDEHQKVRENEKPQNLNQYLVAAISKSCAFETVAKCERLMCGSNLNVNGSFESAIKTLDPLWW